MLSYVNYHSHRHQPIQVYCLSRRNKVIPSVSQKTIFPSLADAQSMFYVKIRKRHLQLTIRKITFSL